MGFNLQMPDYSFLMNRRPNMADAVHSGIAGFKEGNSLRDLVEQTKRKRELESTLRSLGAENDLTNPDGMQNTIRGLANKGFIDEAMGLQKMAPKPPENSYTPFSGMGPDGNPQMFAFNQGQGTFTPAQGVAPLPQQSASQAKPEIHKVPGYKPFTIENGRAVFVEDAPIIPKDTGKETRGVINEINGRKVLVDPVSGSQQDLGPITPKPTTTPKQTENVKTKLTTLRLAKTQLQNVRDSFKKIKGSFSAGLFADKLPTEPGKSFDAAVDALRQTARQLTRTPGEGAMSDFETRLAQAALPNRGNYESVTEQQIAQFEDLINTLEQGYTSMTESEPSESPAPNKADSLRSKYKY